MSDFYFQFNNAPLMIAIYIYILMLLPWLNDANIGKAVQSVGKKRLHVPLSSARNSPNCVFQYMFLLGCFFFFGLINVKENDAILENSKLCESLTMTQTIRSCRVS